MPEHKAKKSLGQNFLQDQNIARKIVKTLKIDSSDRVVEIGPGPGMLTRFILEAAPRELCLVEKDDVMARAWQEKADALAAPVTVLHMDALKIDWSAYVEPVKIIGNLPYNVASPLLWDIMSLAGGLVCAVFMVQREVGERLVAQPSTSAYGALSIWIQSFSRPRLEFTVSPQVFKPRPKVHSAVVSFEPLPPDTWPGNKDALSYILKMFFRHRRKQLAGILRSQGYDPELPHIFGIDPASRPENLSVAQYKVMSEKFLINTRI